MNSPLLQEPLPVMKPDRPMVYMLSGYTTGIDTDFICVAGVGKAEVPHLVRDAIDELQQHGMWEAMGYHCIGEMVGNHVKPNMAVALLALCLRYDEMNYVSFEPA